MNKLWVVLFLMVAMTFWVVSDSTLASVTNGYDLSWWTVDSGGGRSTGGLYALSGTIGQPDTGEMRGGQYTLSGGYWGRFFWEIYLPLVVR